MKKKLIFNKYIVLYLLLAFVPRVFLIHFMWPLHIPLDELSTIALPAYISGYDWSYLMGKTQYYYGYGMAILFTPIFKLIENPILLYRIILMMCALLQVVPGVIAFYILGKFFNQMNQKYKLLLALCASYCVPIPPTTIGNEFMLYIIAWMIGWMLLELINCKNHTRKRIYTVVLVIVILYSYTCHERSKVFLIAIICIIVLYGLLERSFLVSPIAFFTMLSMSYKIVILLTDKVRDIIWPLGNTKAVLVNSSVSIPVNLLGKRELWYIWYNIILGQLGTGAVFTGGTLLLAIVLGIWLFVKKIKLNRSICNNIVNNYVYVLLFGLLTIGAIIFAQSLTWLENARDAVIDSTLSEGGRAFTYLRYFFPCVSMVIVLTLNWLIVHSKDNSGKWIMRVAAILVILLQINFIVGIIPIIQRTPITNYIHNVYWVFSFKKDGYWTNKWTFIPACIICIVFFFLFLLFTIKCSKKEVALCFLSLLLVYQNIAKGIAIDIPRSVQNYCEVRDTLNVIKMMEKDDILPNYIGVTSEQIATTKQPTRFIYQYFLKNRKVSYYEKFEGVKDAIYITSYEVVPFTDITEDIDRWFKIKLDENQYIFFKGDELKKYFTKKGFNCVAVN